MAHGGGPGDARLWLYAARPGTAGTTPAQWPTATTRPAEQALPTLVMFVHPMCPCSRASVRELARLMSDTAGRVKVRVVAVRPAGTPEKWEASTLVQDVRALPGVELLFDRTGDEAKRFGAKTSGHVVLYDAAGKLMFSGGITSSRGHSGDNAGEDAIVSLINGRADTQLARAAIYGCPLPDKQN